MNWLKLLACLGTYCLISSSSLNAAAYFVAPDGNDANPGTKELPWKTIRRATKYGYPVQYRQPGDVVYLRGGLYSGNANGIDLNGAVGAVSGTANAPITVAAYPGETPVVSGTTSPNPAISLKYLNHWYFDGIVYSNNYRNVALTACTNIVLTNCVFGWSPDPGTNWSDHFAWSSVIITSGSQSNRITHCQFRDWGCVVEQGDIDQDIGNHISLGNSVSDTADYYNLIESCTFIHGGHDHVAVNTGWNVVRSNLFVNDPWVRTNATINLMNFGSEVNHYGAYGNRQLKPGDGDSPNQCDQRNVYEWNTFLYTGPPSDDNGASGIELVNRLAIVRFNTIAYSLASGIFLTAMSSYNYAVSNAIYGNVIYGNGLAAVYGGQGMESFTGGLTMNNSGGLYLARSNYVVNNILWHNHSKYASSNVWDICWQYQQMRTNWVGEAGLPDPLFYSTNGLQFITNASDWYLCYNETNVPDFRIATNSPCVDAGTWLAYCVGSGSGTTLTVDNSLYFSDGNRIVPGDWIQLQGQTNLSQIVSNDWERNTLYLSSALSWTNGQGVSLPYSGSAPDQGAYEVRIASGGGSAQAAGAGGTAAQPIPPPSGLRIRPPQ